MLRRLRTLTERECYARCYGAGDDGVRIVVRREASRAREPAAPPRTAEVRAVARPSSNGTMSGEQLRRLLEERLDTREPRAA